MSVAPASRYLHLKTWLRRSWRQSRVVVTATAVAGAVLGLRMSGGLQLFELAAIDQGFRWRDIQPHDDRIVIVGITEQDIQNLKGWPIDDATLAQLLNQIKAAQPRVIGMDIYRNVSRDADPKLRQIFQTTPNLIGIEYRGIKGGTAPVPPPPELKKRNQVGFNNVIGDLDQRVRRSVLYWPHDEIDVTARDTRSNEPHKSFSLKIALKYLEPTHIQEEEAPGNHRPKALQLGKAILPSLQKNDSVYVRADVGGYQILADYQGPSQHFQTVSITEVLEHKVPPELFRDRIVLIGSVAESLKDYMATPYSNLFQDSPAVMHGVEIQANFVSQLLYAAITGRGVFQTLPEPLEWLLVWICAYWGTYVSWRLRSPGRSIVAISITCLGLIACVYASFVGYWIVPIVPPFIALVAASVVVTSYIAHAEEELKRSKEFLHRVINSIPDPIFVKDRDHRWIVLNQAYAEFVGIPIDDLLGCSAEVVLPAEQAQQLKEQENQVFQTNRTIELEEEFVNLKGQHYHIATKRSLHRDGAGNVFLVGVIHDITERKTLEEELKRTRDRLSQDNSQLSYLANHDPLTGLPNRNLFRERVRQAIDKAASQQQQFALLFLDLDGFKQVNDTLGHTIGDLLLQAVAKRLSACLRSSDTVARLGGDEFVVIVPYIPGVAVAKRVAKKILTTLAEGFTLEGNIIRVTTSIGISMYPGNSDELESLIQTADEAMYEAKQAGKNQFVVSRAQPATRKSLQPTLETPVH
jgi:diguanylate cyclase (GGDEF)-like protein/PAS domain S-box-containing protein